MTFDAYKKIFSRFGFVVWNGTKYRATGIKCVKAHGRNEKINSVKITTLDGRTEYWLAPSELEEAKR